MQKCPSDFSFFICTLELRTRGRDCGTGWGWLGSGRWERSPIPGVSTGCWVPGAGTAATPLYPSCTHWGVWAGFEPESPKIFMGCWTLGCKCGLELLVRWELYAGLREATGTVSAVKIPFSGETQVIDTGFAPGVAGRENKDEWKMCWRNCETDPSQGGD